MVFPFELTVPDDDGIVVAGGDTATELFTVSRLKVFPGGSQDIGRGVQSEKLRCPLFCQVVRHNKERLLAQAKSLALHCRRDHLERLPSPYLVGKQRISAVEDVGHSVQLSCCLADMCDLIELVFAHRARKSTFYLLIIFELRLHA